MYIGDGQGRILSKQSGSSTIDTLIGLGTDTNVVYNHLEGLTGDNEGFLYMTDWNKNNIIKIDLSDNSTSVLYTDSKDNSTYGITNGDGKLYFTTKYEVSELGFDGSSYEELIEESEGLLFYNCALLDYSGIGLILSEEYEDNLNILASENTLEEIVSKEDLEQGQVYAIAKTNEGDLILAGNVDVKKIIIK